MTNQIYQKSIPEKWLPKYFLKRIKQEDIVISQKERDQIQECMSKSQRFIQLREHILMVNSIYSIDPFWGEPNIPPQPKPRYDHDGEKIIVINQEEIDLWQKIFGEVEAKKND